VGVDSGRTRGERFLVLDAMRGLAAYIVVIHHAYGGGDDPSNPLRAGYLAVDFFFILSGFVISHAYEERLRNGLPFRQFAWARARRLVPTMWIGILIGAAWSDLALRHPGMAMMLVPAAFAFLPLLGSNIGIYPLNGVQWSLFFELVANALHASLLWRLRMPILVGIWLISLTVMAIGSYSLGNLSVGDRTDTFFLGYSRVGFGYVTGMLLFRMRARLQFASVPAGVPLIALLLLIAAVSRNDTWGTEMIAVAILPLLVLSGLSAGSGWPRLFDYLGRLSFPVYAVHAPIVFFCADLPPTYRLGVELAAVTAVAAAVEQLTRGGVTQRLVRSLMPPRVGVSAS